MDFIDIMVIENKINSSDTKLVASKLKLKSLTVDVMHFRIRHIIGSILL